MNTFMHPPTYAHTHTHVPSYPPTHAHAHIHARAHTHTHACTYAHAHTHTLTIFMVYNCFNEFIVLSNRHTIPPPSTVSTVRANRLGVRASKSYNHDKQIIPNAA